MADRAFHKALETVVLTQFPNPERKDCPGIQNLRRIANKTISMRDPIIDHVGHCSPCFKELQEIRADVHQRRVLVAVGYGMAFAVLILVGYFAFSGPGGNSPPNVQPNTETAEIDLRGFSTVRGDAQPENTSPPPVIHRGSGAVKIQLPVGAGEGAYDVGVKGHGDSMLTTSRGEAKLEDHITILRVSIDTMHIPPGKYTLGIRRPKFDWRYYPVLIR